MPLGLVTSMWQLQDPIPGASPTPTSVSPPPSLEVKTPHLSRHQKGGLLATGPAGTTSCVYSFKCWDLEYFGKGLLEN